MKIDFKTVILKELGRQTALAMTIQFNLAQIHIYIYIHTYAK